jgi:hypothetical protein
VYLNIRTPEIYFIVFLLCILTDPPLTVRHIFEDNHNWGAFRIMEKDNLRDVEINEVNKMRFFNCVAATLPLWGTKPDLGGVPNLRMATHKDGTMEYHI